MWLACYTISTACEVEGLIMSREEAISFFESRLKWKKENRYPYVSQQEVEAIQIAIEAINRKEQENDKDTM